MDIGDGVSQVIESVLNEMIVLQSLQQSLNLDKRSDFGHSTDLKRSPQLMFVGRWLFVNFLPIGIKEVLSSICCHQL